MSNLDTKVSRLLPDSITGEAVPEKSPLPVPSISLWPFGLLLRLAAFTRTFKLGLLGHFLDVFTVSGIEKRFD